MTTICILENIICFSSYFGFKSGYICRFEDLKMKVILLLLLGLSLCSSEDPHWHERDDGYIDIFDLENFDHSTNTMKNTIEKKPTSINDVSPNEKSKDLNMNLPGETKKTAHDSNSENKQMPKPAKPTTTARPTEEKQITTTSSPYDDDKSSSLPLSLYIQYINTLIYHFKHKVEMETTELNLRVRLSPREIKNLQIFSTDPSDKHLTQAHEVISTMVRHVSVVDPMSHSTRRLWLEDTLGIRIEMALALMVTICVIIVATAILLHKDLCWWRVVTRLLVLLFIISVGMTWYSLYKRQEAESHLSLMKEMPAHCRSQAQNQSVWQVMKGFFSDTFTFQKEECIKYYEHMILDPIWKVAPTEALSVTFVNFFIAPLRHIARGIHQFITELLSGLPVQLWPVMLILITLFVLVVLFMGFGYRISLPLIAIEPKRTNSTAILQKIQQHTELMQAVKENILQELQSLSNQVNEQTLKSIEAIILKSVNGQQAICQTESVGAKGEPHLTETVVSTESKEKQTTTPSTKDCNNSVEKAEGNRIPETCTSQECSE